MMITNFVFMRLKVIYLLILGVCISCNSDQGNDRDDQNPEIISDSTFNQAKWKTREGKTYPYRAEMYKDVLYNDTIRNLNEQEILALLGEPNRKKDGYYYYTISKTSILSWNLHTRILVIKFTDSQTIEWIKVHE